VLTKRERVKKNEPYQPFTESDLQAFFDPASHLETMDAPDVFWSPLVRIGPAPRTSEGRPPLREATDAPPSLKPSDRANARGRLLVDSDRAAIALA